MAELAVERDGHGECEVILRGVAARRTTSCGWGARLAYHCVEQQSLDGAIGDGGEQRCVSGRLLLPHSSFQPAVSLDDASLGQAPGATPGEAGAPAQTMYRAYGNAGRIVFCIDIQILMYKSGVRSERSSENGDGEDRPYFGAMR